MGNKERLNLVIKKNKLSFPIMTKNYPVKQNDHFG